MTVLGLDSAARTGFAVVSGEPGGRERLLRYGAWPIRGAADVGAAVAQLVADEPHLVAIEAPYVRANAATGLTLTTLVGRWLQEWERRGVPTTTVLGSTWQIGILAGLITRRSDRSARKAAAPLWLQGTHGLALGEDETDAVGIATWALRRALVAQRAA